MSAILSLRTWRGRGELRPKRLFNLFCDLLISDGDCLFAFGAGDDGGLFFLKNENCYRLTLALCGKT